MLCSYPLVLGKNRIHGCGQCLSCRVNSSRKWATRLALESKISSQTWFGTLTYAEENLPHELQKRHVQSFLDRLRKRLEGVTGPIRYYACGEYGSKTGRPHYHFLLFLRKPIDTLGLRCHVAKAWKLGRTQCELTNSHAAGRYVSKYVTKKATKEWEDDKPEWHLSSRKPGIGSEAIKGICESLLHYGYFNGHDDVPSHIEIDGKSQPLDYYIRNLMREYMLHNYGLVCDTSKASKEFALTFEELWEDYKMAVYAAEKLGSTTARYGLYANFGGYIADNYLGKRVAFEKRLDEKRGRRKL